MQGVQSILKQLPEKYQKVLEECEREEKYEGPEYEEACLEFANSLHAAWILFQRDYKILSRTCQKIARPN